MTVGKRRRCGERRRLYIALRFIVHQGVERYASPFPDDYPSPHFDPRDKQHGLTSI
ncbi:MAG: hypothetical protein RMK00_00010 [Bacteroidota bacterium]|nr:hypothetical protein [Bacteroidota bacterium]